MATKDICTTAVIAFKFNDIYYATSTLEWQRSYYKILILIVTDNVTSNDFPQKELFDKVIIIKYSRSFIFLFYAWWQVLSKFAKCKVDIVFLSNPILIVNQLIIKKLCVSKIILLEDGLMNYYQFVPPQYRLKRLLQYIFDISDEFVFDRIIYTYLLDPNNAIFWKKERKELLLDVSVQSQFRDIIQNKIIFAGVPIYKSNKITVEQYNRVVNQIIQDYKVDYYVPHIFASPKENIDCEVLDLNKYAVTLEVLASQYVFTIISLGSSVLYTTKLINPSIESILVKPKEWSLNVLSIIVKKCDQVLVL